jgi:hypothetical protein
MAGNREGERRFAASVRAHERVNFSPIDGEIDPLEDFLAGDLAPEVGDTKSVVGHGIYRSRGSLRKSRKNFTI